MRFVITTVIAALILAACVADDPSIVGIDLEEGLVAEVIVDGLSGPTQIVALDDGSFVVALINGGENEGVGQVVRVGPDADPVVLFDGLDKPTGVAVRSDEVFVMERDRLSVGSISGGALEPIATDLPNNGRSEGAISVAPSDRVFVNTSGSRRGAVASPGSGIVWEVVDDGDGYLLEQVSDGFKHAYALAFDGDRIWTVEVSDGSFDGAPPMDEVVEVTSAGGGWPLCVGDNRPVAEFGVTAQDCESFPASRAVFDAGATPTSIVVSPFESDTLLVALWLTGEVVSVPTQGNDPTDWTVIASGLSNPQHLVVRDGEVYLSEFSAGRILRLRER